MANERKAQKVMIIGGELSEPDFKKLTEALADQYPDGVEIVVDGDDSIPIIDKERFRDIDTILPYIICKTPDYKIDLPLHTKPPAFKRRNYKR